jgi:hypothetical protein
MSDDLEEGKITKWLTAPSRKRALASKMRQHSINISKKGNYGKAGDISGEDNPSKDPTGHGRGYSQRGKKETGEGMSGGGFSTKFRRMAAAEPGNEKNNRPVINNGPKSITMRKKLTAKYSAMGRKDGDHSQKWWKKAEKLDPLEESIAGALIAGHLVGGALGYKLTKKNGVLDKLVARKKAKSELSKEVKRNSGPSGDDFQPTSRSSRLLKKLKEGSIKDLVTQDQEEKRLLKTDKPQKVLSNKGRKQLSGLQKIAKMYGGLTATDGKKTVSYTGSGKVKKKLDELSSNTYASAADKATNEYMSGNKKRAWLADKATNKFNERKSKKLDEGWFSKKPKKVYDSSKDDDVSKKARENAERLISTSEKIDALLAARKKRKSK